MMLFNWTAEDSLRQDGFSDQVLDDERTCLLWAKGYFFDSSGHMWLNDEIVDWLTMHLRDHRLSDLIPEMNGCFSLAVVWRKTRTIEVGVDRLGTIPVYYHIGSRKFIISDNFWKVAHRLLSVEYEPDAILSMALLGYIAGYRTLLKGVAELPQAAIHRFSFADDVPQLVSQRYWMLSYHTGPQRKREAWRDALAHTLNMTFARHAQAISARDWNVYIPLSGGRDSRLTAGMFSRNSVPVQAFSYGPSGNAEPQSAAQVAKALDTPFRFVLVDDPFCLQPTLIQTMTRRVGMRARFTAGLGGQLSLTAFSEQDVYVPGHPGGFVPSVPLSRGALIVGSEVQAIQQLINMHLLPLFDEMGVAIFPKTWERASKSKVITHAWHFDAADPIGSMHRWECENRQRRLILSELLTYEQFGRWLLPFCDHEFLDFFATVPLGLRYQERLYVDTLIHNIFVNDLAPLRRIPLAYKGDLQLPVPSWRDRVYWILMRFPTTVIQDWILMQSTYSKHREHLASVGARSIRPSAPDPLDHWWYDYPEFRQGVIDLLRGWDGMHGVIDVSTLGNMLQKPLPRLFIQFVVPAFLTMRCFQQIVESELVHD